MVKFQEVGCEGAHQRYLMTQEQFKELLRCQQGKLNAVLMS